MPARSGNSSGKIRKTRSCDDIGIALLIDPGSSIVIIQGTVFDTRGKELLAVGLVLVTDPSAVAQTPAIAST
jgi:hypothetical protein